MPELTSHPDEFTLLRLTTGDLDDVSRTQAERHVESCSGCGSRLEEMRRLDAELREFDDRERLILAESPELAAGDPFRKRPALEPVDRSRRFPLLVEVAVAASESGARRKHDLLGGVDDSRRLAGLLGSLSLSEPADRYALLYSLQEAGHGIARAPEQTRRFAGEVLDWLRARTEQDRPHDGLVERIVPRFLLLGRTHLLAGQACNWLGEHDTAETHCRIAYRLFAQAADEIGLASAEMLEAQRRFFVGRGAEALALARRACATFEAYGFEDAVGRARCVEGMALLGMGRTEEALRAYRSSLGTFEDHGLWSNYVMALNNSGVCLVKLGRLDEARREYARALRRLSRDEHRSSLALVRHGLAEVLFAAGRFRQAAKSLSDARRLYAECGMRSGVFSAWLLEIESWAKSGDLDVANQEFGAFRRAVASDSSLDHSVVERIERALAGLDPDFANIADLRFEAEAALPQSSRGLSA